MKIINRTACRGWTLKGIPNRCEEFNPSMADFYDLIIGLHPDEATRSVVESAHLKPVIMIPCCKWWSDKKLGRDELIEEIENYYQKHQIKFEKVIFSFRGPKNIGLVSNPSEKHRK